MTRRVLGKARRTFNVRVGRPTLDRLELHVTHACNLTCESCSHYSDHGHRGNLDLAEADRWMAAWSGRIAVKHFNLLGGEPTIHPGLCEFVPLVRRHWPKGHIRVVTNGFLLHRHPDLPKAIAAAGDASLALSVHHDGEGYRERLRPVRALIDSWKRDHRIKVQIRPSHQTWTRRYQGFGAAMLPFEEGRPRQSWEVCQARCNQLYDGKIWKCPPLAYLGLQKAKFDLSPKWDPYLRYQGLEPACSDSELKTFLLLEDESFCAMCSAKPLHFALPDPMRKGSRASPPSHVPELAKAGPNSQSSAKSLKSAGSGTNG